MGTFSFIDKDHLNILWRLKGDSSGGDGDSSECETQTGAEIKELYEGESNTNAFTDTLMAKLSLIDPDSAATDAASVLAAGAQMQGNVLIKRPNGDVISYKASADSNAHRGFALKNAQSAWVDGDTIYVGPGTYDCADILEDGIVYYFSAGAVVDYTGFGGLPIIYDREEDWTFVIDGYGEFIHRGNAPAASREQCVALHGNTSGVIRAKYIRSDTSVAIRGGTATGNSNLYVHCDVISAYDGTIDNIGDGSHIWLHSDHISSDINFVIECDDGHTYVMGGGGQCILESLSTSEPIQCFSGSIHLFNCKIISQAGIFSGSVAGESVTNHMIDCEFDTTFDGHTIGLSGEECYLVTKGCWRTDGDPRVFSLTDNNVLHKDVISWNGRQGVVVPVTEDYDSDMVVNVSEQDGYSVSDALDAIGLLVDGVAYTGTAPIITGSFAFWEDTETIRGTSHMSTDGTDVTLQNTLYAGAISTSSISLLGSNIGPAIILNTAKETNATHTGDVIGDVALTIVNNAIDIGHFSATGTPSSSTYLRGDNTWASISGSGDVSQTGSVADNQIAIWTTDYIIEGLAALTFVANTLGVDGDVEATGSISSEYYISSDGPMYVNAGLITPVGALYFHDGTNQQGGSLKFDSATDIFELSHSTYVTGDITLSGTVDGIDIATEVILKDGSVGDEYLAIWTDEGKLKGDSGLIWDGSDLTVVGGVVVDSLVISETTQGTKTNVDLTIDPTLSAMDTGVYTNVNVDTLLDANGQMLVGTNVIGIENNLILSGTPAVAVSVKAQSYLSEIDFGGILVGGGKTEAPIRVAISGLAATQDYQNGAVCIEVDSGVSTTSKNIIAMRTIANGYGDADVAGYSGYAAGATGAAHTGSVVGVQGVVVHDSGSTHSLAISVDAVQSGTGLTPADKRMGLRCYKHALVRYGSLFVSDDAAATSPNYLSPTHIDPLTDFGCAYIEYDLEVDGETFMDGNTSFSVASVSSTGTVGTNTYELIDASGGAITRTLPAVATCTGRIYTFKKTDSSLYAVTIATPSTETIDGQATYSVPTQYQAIKLISDGSNWYVV